MGSDRRGSMKSVSDKPSAMSLIEPAQFVRSIKHLPPDRRHAIWNRCTRESRAEGVVMLIFLGGPLLVWLTGGWLHDAMLRQGWADHTLAVQLVIIGLLLIAALVSHRWLTHRQIRKWLIKHRVGNRLPVCLTCGYDLRGTPVDATHCPECGGWVGVPDEKHE